MDFLRSLKATSQNYLLTKLIYAYKNNDRLIIAYDFDDTVKPYWCSSCENVKSTLRLAKEYLNAYFIVYTCNTNIEGIKEYLDKEQIPYDSINENAPFIHNVNGKIFYNIFLDDKAGLGEAIRALEDLIDLVHNKTIEKEV